MTFKRQIRYYYLTFIHLKGEPNELALGMAIGVFSGLLPIVPFQTALAVTLAIFFRASKITAALGTWVSNPLNWYFLYYYSYKLGAFIMGLSGHRAVFSSIMKAVRSGEASMVIVEKTLGAGTSFVTAFLLGGFLLGIVLSPIAYLIFLQLFRSVRGWRQTREERKKCPVSDP